jgi:short-subunit dehydrogenase
MLDKSQINMNLQGMALGIACQIRDRAIMGKSMANLKKNVLITGTTSGIGYELAKCFASEGYGLVLASRNRGKLDEQQKELEERYSVPVYAIAIDLSEENAAEKICQELQGAGLQIHILVNNAGFNEFGEFVNTSIKNETNMIHLHAVALTQLTKLLLPNMISDGWGHILNVGSIASYAPFPLNAVYAASKAYVLSFSLALRTELKGKNVNVTALTPGATKTLFAEKSNMGHTFLFTHFVMPPDKVANKAMRGMFNNKATVIPGVYSKLLVLAMKIVPYAILQKAALLFYGNKKQAL